MTEQDAIPNGALEYNAISTSLENERRLIAAAKIQRWETVKWVVTVNSALTAAAVALLNSANAIVICLAFAGLALFVSIVANELLRHDNDDHLRGARRAAWLLENHLEHEYGFDVRETAQQTKQEPPHDYDYKELSPYRRAIGWSAAPLLLVAAWAVYDVAVSGQPVQ